MQFFDDTQSWDENQIIHRIIDELVNIVGLCQLLSRAWEPSEIQRYTDILSDVTNDTIQLCNELKSRHMPEL